MKELGEKILNEGVYLGKGIIKVDGFVNHQLEPQLMLRMGEEFKRLFDEAGVDGVTRVISAESSGIAPALTTGIAYDVPITFARKKKPLTMEGSHLFSASAPSRTKGDMVNLYISSQYLHASDRVLIIDDFLATGQTIEALVSIIEDAGATLLGIGTMIEKTFEGGRERLSKQNLPLKSLAKVAIENDEIILVQSE